ncbi:orange carotenoid protein N-terminal domain-containing protein [Chroococcidiopsis sp. CCNUC1]|uniref:orange carotenoid protein N-terminal domain-containing protein n=1 Tax=Chroococcidiopsis sp. CCNUC1 TaxID=2653189 RepID=UPI0019FFE722|nr:orange carotenoid protein N-terminal domain-containing protein [Chroococcidiopsis sp. CCNUC1]MBE9016801.1 orange carotenoid protein [Chroococcidiopsidales cyanobacterium LEGE 13417]URD48230.1 orange carotenoid protein [Chroococcidiopsis sp. CCNUC1]
MTYTTESAFSFASNRLKSDFQLADAVPATISLVKRLSTDDQLALLWYAYTEMGRSITPAAPGAARLQLAEGLLNSLKQMSHAQQLEAMRDLVERKNTPISRSYGILSNNTKLAFWYELSELMVQGFVVPMPTGYQPSRDVNETLATIKQLDFGQQITVLRKLVADMGVDPLAD